MRKILWLFLAAMSLMNCVYAAEISGFSLIANPDNVKVWEPIDFTVKAVDDKGSINTEYIWDILIQVLELKNEDYKVPNEWMYTFKDEDLWEKVFSKGLIFHKAWVYTVRVEDFSELEEGIFGEVKVTVTDVDDGVDIWEIEVKEPSEWEIIEKPTLDIYWVSELKNSKVTVYIDGKKVWEWLTLWNGDLNTQVEWLTNWDHYLELKVFDLKWNTIWSSNAVTFSVNLWNELLVELKVAPSNTLSQWQTATITVLTDVSATSANLEIVGMWEYPMQKLWVDRFETKVLMDKPGIFDVNLNIVANEKSKDYEKAEKITVLERKAITEVKYVRDNNQKTIDLNWQFVWIIPQFRVVYGTGKDNMSQEAIVSQNKLLIEWIEVATTYFAKIIPLNSDWVPDGDESKLIVIEANMKQAASCKIDNIHTNVKVEWWKHYLVWDRVEWAEKYVVFKWDKVTDLRKIVEINDTQYQFPFDENASENVYAYFVVKALCSDWSLHQIDKVKRVKVWPADFLFVAFMITLVVYWLYNSLIIRR